MTDVLIDLGRDAPGARAGRAGALVATASEPRSEGAELTLPEPVRVPLVSGVVNRVPLEAPGPDWYWRLEVYVGINLYAVREAVTFSGPEVEWEDLVDLDPASLEPDAEPEAAWRVELDAVRQLAETGATPEALEQAVGTRLAEHVNAPSPHPAYDEGPSLVLLFANKLI